MNAHARGAVLDRSDILNAGVTPGSGPETAEAAQSIYQFPAQPSFWEVIGLASVTAVLFSATILSFKEYRVAVEHFGDSPAYEQVASAIRHWDFAGLQIKQFWGYSYAVAAVAGILRISDGTALLLVSWFCSVLSTVLAWRLWGGWVASFFCVLNFDWLQRSYLGGSEPLAVALLFGAFLAVRKNRHLLAVLLAALSTVVRPLGIFALIGVGIVLIYKREYKKLTLATTIGLAIGALYIIPFTHYFGDALATVHSYEGGSRPLFGFPLHAIFAGTFLYPAPLTNMLLSFGWIGLVLAGCLAMACTTRFREYAKKNPVEVLFGVPFVFAIFCYNYPVFARSNFSRFIIPALPIIYVALSQWLPKDRRIIWGLAVISPVLAASSALGIRNVAHLLHL